MNSRQDDRRHLINGLRAVADFYEQHPDAYYDGMSVSLSMYVSSGNARSVLQKMAKAFGEYEESYDEKHAAVSRRFGKKVKVELFAARAGVCRRTVVAVHVEPSLVVPATSEICIPQRTVEVVEWSCLPLLGARDA